MTIKMLEVFTIMVKIVRIILRIVRAGMDEAFKAQCIWRRIKCMLTTVYIYLKMTIYQYFYVHKLHTYEKYLWWGTFVVINFRWIFLNDISSYEKFLKFTTWTTLTAVLFTYTYFMITFMKIKIHCISSMIINLQLRKHLLITDCLRILIYLKCTLYV